MRTKEERMFHTQLAAFLERIVDRLEQPARGITLQVIDEGVDSLSEKQEHVFDRYVIGEYAVENCTKCGCSIPWSEKADAYDNGGYCGWCEHMRQKALASTS